MLNEELCLEAQFSLYHSRDGTAAHPCRGCTNPSIIFLLHPPPHTLEQIPTNLTCEPFSDLDLGFHFRRSRSGSEPTLMVRCAKNPK